MIGRSLMKQESGVRSQESEEKKSVKSVEAVSALSFWILTPGSWLLFLRLYQPVVSILTLINHADAVGVGIAENEKLIGLFRQTQRSFFSRHRLHNIAPRRDDARRARAGFNL